MPKNALKMSEWCLLLLAFNLITLSICDLHLIITEYDDYNDFGDESKRVSSSIERIAGTDFHLTCEVGGPGLFSEPELVWGRRSKDLRFKNENELIKLAEDNSTALYHLYNTSYKSVSRAYRYFHPLKLTDRGAHFCMSWKYKLFKIIHIKVKEEEVDPFADNEDLDVPLCGKDKFRCEISGYCINLHYKCDGRSDCRDDSDESWKLCNGDPCEGKIRCNDGRCIPTSWCCDRRTEENCTVAVRPDCCPPLPDPYDPIHWYNKNENDVKELHRSNGSKYLFITICVVSAILSFVLFLFVISKICGFDAKPRSRSADTRCHQVESPEFTRCMHSQCAIRREFNPNAGCIYLAGAIAQSADNNNEMADPLILVIRGSSPSEVSDQPPSYSEVVSIPPCTDKSMLDDLINVPPPSYASTKLFSETETGGNTTSASDNNTSVNQSCDIGTTGDSSNNNA